MAAVIADLDIGGLMEKAVSGNPRCLLVSFPTMNVGVGCSRRVPDKMETESEGEEDLFVSQGVTPFTFFVLS